MRIYFIIIVIVSFAILLLLKNNHFLRFYQQQYYGSCFLVAYTCKDITINLCEPYQNQEDVIPTVLIYSLKDCGKFTRGCTVPVMVRGISLMKEEQI